MTALVTAETPSRSASVQKVVSKGGIEAWLVEDYAVPLVALECAFKGGAAQDPEGKPGAMTLLAGLLDEGAGSLDAAAFHQALDEDAIELSFSADRDVTTGRMQTLARNVPRAFELLRLAVNETRLDAEPFERVDGHMMASLKRGDLVETGRRVLARDGLKIAVVGAIDAASLGTYLDDVFGALPAKGDRLVIPDVVFSGEGRRQVVDLDIPQSNIRFGRQGIARKDDDFIAASVVNHILGGGIFSARLFREVREKRGLAYSVYSQLVTFDHAAMMSGGTSTKNERVVESLDVIQEQIRDLADAGPTEEELDKARKYLIGSYALRFDTSTKIAAHLVHLQTEGFDVDYLDARNKLIAGVTMEDAKRVAKRLFGDGSLLVVIAGRPENL